jgi:hypothetical protein
VDWFKLHLNIVFESMAVLPAELTSGAVMFEASDGHFAKYRIGVDGKASPLQDFAGQERGA